MRVCVSRVGQVRTAVVATVCLSVSLGPYAWAGKSVYGRARTMVEARLLGDPGFVSALKELRTVQHELGFTRAHIRSWRAGRHARTKLSHALGLIESLALTPWVSPRLAKDLKAKKAEADRVADGLETGQTCRADFKVAMDAYSNAAKQVDSTIGDLFNQAYGDAAMAYLDMPHALGLDPLKNALVEQGISYGELSRPYQQALGKLVRAKKGIWQAENLWAKAFEAGTGGAEVLKTNSGSEVLNAIGALEVLDARAAFKSFAGGLDLLVGRGLGIVDEARLARTDPLMDEILSLSSPTGGSGSVKTESGALSPQEFAAVRTDEYNPNLVIDAVHALITSEAEPVIH